MIRETEATIGGLTVSRETVAALRTFEGLVRKWSGTINLVSKPSLEDLWDRHIADSAQLFGFCPEKAENWADLGSGGGFPGIVIAVLAQELRPGLHVKLVESDQRKAAFLREVARVLGLSLSVIDERIETLSPLEADVVSARALAPLTDLLAFAATHLRSDGIAVFPKGARHNAELADARRVWMFDCQLHPSLSDSEAAILVIRNIHRER